MPTTPIGRRLANARLRRGLSQGTVARLARLDPSYISRIETGRVTPTIRTLRRVADAMHVPIEEIAGKAPTNGAAARPCPVSHSGVCLMDLVRSEATGGHPDDHVLFTPSQIKLIRRFAEWVRTTTHDRHRAMEVLLRDLGGTTRAGN